MPWAEGGNADSDEKSGVIAVQISLCHHVVRDVGRLPTLIKFIADLTTGDDRALPGREVHETKGDRLSINHDTGVITISRVEGFEEVTTHYSPAAWEMVTHRVTASHGRAALPDLRRRPHPDLDLISQPTTVKNGGELAELLLIQIGDSK